jgi:uncharacterized FlaG/YvyC family protein
MVTHPSPSTATADSENAADVVARKAALEARKAASAGAAEVPDLWDNEILRQLHEVARDADPTLPKFSRAELTLEKATGQIVVRIVKFESEEVVRAYSPQESLRLLTQVRERLGPLLSAQV